MSPEFISVLGATGSIGASTLRVIEEHPDRYAVYALTANTSVDAMLQLCARHRPKLAVMHHQASALELRTRLAAAGLAIEVLGGMEGLITAATATEVTRVMAAIVGSIGLAPTLAAARAGKTVLLANKESLVMAGDLFMQAVTVAGSRVLPIDSEHNAIFQCLPVGPDAQVDHDARNGISRIILTASGGPFLDTPSSQLVKVTPDQACAHPNWSMGRKISVDSATLMNKALELIEACYLFAVAEERVDVVIHPQSIVHSMVSYSDGSVLAQLGNPDMRTPIAYGLAWPERIGSGVEPLDLVRIGQLDFRAPDLTRFPCLKLGRDAVAARGAAPIVLNAANEVAVEAFLTGAIGFTAIPAIIADLLERDWMGPVESLDEVLAIDGRARELTAGLLKKYA